MQSLPSTTFGLVLFMAVSAGILVNHILKAGFYTTLASIPLLLLAGLFGNALTMSNNILLFPDKASNIALSASFGFILLASISILLVRLWSLMRDRR